MNAVNQFPGTDLAVFQLLQSLKNAVKTSLTDRGWMYSDLVIGDHLGGQIPESFRELEVFRFCKYVCATNPLEGFAERGVSKSTLLKIVSGLNKKICKNDEH